MDPLAAGTAQLLPRLLRGRQAGPVFLTDRRAPARTPALDVCPVTGPARLSHLRAAELFTDATRAPGPSGAGWTLHQLRHSDLTQEAEDGASTPMLLARSRHAPVRSLERYARPGVDAVGAYVARPDPAARRRHPGGSVPCRDASRRGAGVILPAGAVEPGTALAATAAVETSAARDLEPVAEPPVGARGLLVLTLPAQSVTTVVLAVPRPAPV